MVQSNDGVALATPENADDAWAESMREVMREVIASLPDHTTLGELVEAARSNRAMTSVLEIFTVQELIETVQKRPKIVAPPRQVPVAASEGHGEADAPAIIRRRADVPDGDLRILRTLADRGPLRESDLANHAQLASDQLRIILRHLRTKSFIHIEGSGIKRRIKITRNGSGYLRKHK